MEYLKTKIFWLFLSLVILLTVGFSFADQWSWYVLAGLVLILVIILFIRFPQLGIYFIAFLFPFNYLEFVYGQFNVPYVDLVALLLFVAWLIRVVYFHITNKQKLSKKNFPFAFLMFLFVAANALALLNVDREFFNLSIKYILRPIIFFYVMYVILPFNIIDNLKKLFVTFKIMFVLGLGLSFMGIWSLIFPPYEGLRRAVPIAIGGIYPLGTNHNLLAEIFVILIPIALILFWYEKDVFFKNIYLMGFLLMIGVNLLTLSRAGWIAVFVELVIIAIYRYKKEVKHIITSYLPYIILVLFAPVVWLMYKLATSYIMTSSNLNRLKLIETAFTLLMENPFLGKGAGTFIYLVGQMKWYTMQFGSPIDAHGFVFKTLAETGFLGTVFFVLMLTYILMVLHKSYTKSRQHDYQWLVLGLFLAVLGAIIFQFFGTSYYIAKLWLPIGLAFTGLKILKIKYS